MNPAIVDISNFTREIVEKHSADKVARGLEDLGWFMVDRRDVPGVIETYFLSEVYEDEFDAILEEVYSELHNVDAKLSGDV